VRHIGLFTIIVFFVTCAFVMVGGIRPAHAAAGCPFAGTTYPVGAQVCQAGLMYVCSNSGTQDNVTFVWAPLIPQQNC
jgi:hypothetical protein